MSWIHPARIGWGLSRPVEVRGGVIPEVSFVLSLRSPQRAAAGSAAGSQPDHSRITHSRHRTELGVTKGPSPRRSEVGYSAPGLVPGQEHAVGKRPGLTPLRA